VFQFHELTLCPYSRGPYSRSVTLSYSSPCKRFLGTPKNLPPCVSNPRVCSPPLVSVPRRPQSYRVTLLLPFTRQKIFRNPSQTFRRVFQSHVLVPPSVSVPRRPQSYRVTNSYSLPFKRFLGPLTNHPPCVSNPRACPPPCIFRTPHKPSAVCFKSTCLFPPPCVRTSEATVVSRDFLLPLTFQKIFRTPHKPSAVCFKSTCLFSPPLCPYLGGHSRIA
jgi:hypothetical protein